MSVDSVMTAYGEMAQAVAAAVAKAMKAGVRGDTIEAFMGSIICMAEYGADVDDDDDQDGEDDDEDEPDPDPSDEIQFSIN